MSLWNDILQHNFQSICQDLFNLDTLTRMIVFDLNNTHFLRNKGMKVGFSTKLETSTFILDLYFASSFEMVVLVSVYLAFKISCHSLNLDTTHSLYMQILGSHHSKKPQPHLLSCCIIANKINHIYQTEKKNPTK